MFNPDELPMEDKHVTKTLSSPQNHSGSHIDIIQDPSPPTSELGANDPYDSDTQIFTFDISLFNTDDDMPLVHPDLIDWDQQGPPTFNQFENDEAIVEFFELCEGMPHGDHKSGFSIDLNIMAYFGESTPSSSHKIETIKKNTKVGLLVKTKRCHQTMNK